MIPASFFLLSASIAPILLIPEQRLVFLDLFLFIYFQTKNHSNSHFCIELTVWRILPFPPPVTAHKGFRMNQRRHPKKGAEIGGGFGRNEK